MFAQAPAWVRKGAALDLDFANRRWWGGYVSEGSAFSTADRMKSVVSTGSNSALNTNYTPDNRGILIPNRTASQIRITDGMGAWSEVNVTNTCLWCRDLTNAAWTKTNCTVIKTQTGADGVANTATSVTATSSGASVTQGITATAGNSVFSAYVKRLTGSGTVQITMDNTSFTDITASITSTGYTLVQVPLASVTNPVVGVTLATSGDAIAVDFCQQEKLTATGSPTVATTRVLTTSASATRLNGGGTEEMFFYTPASNFNDGLRWITDVVSRRPTGFVIAAAGNGSAGCLICGTDVGGFFATNGVNGSNFTGALGASAAGSVAGLANLNRMAYSRDGATERTCVNGGAIASASAAFSNTLPTHGGMGNRGAGDTSINGYIARATFWKRELTDGEMLEYTR